MTTFKQFAAVAMVLSAGILNGWCADERTAIIDMSRVMDAHPKTATNREILKKQISEFEDERDNMLKKLEELKVDFDKTRREAGNKALNDKAREKSLSMAEDKLVAIREYQQEAREKSSLRQKQINDLRIRMGKRVLEEVREVISEYARKEKIGIVLDSAGIAASGIEVVVYSSDKLDITDDIVKLVAKSE